MQAAQSLPTNKNASGRYGYKSWAHNPQGERVARPYQGKDPRVHADLVSNSYRNVDGVQTVFGVVFDFDAHRAHDCWKNVEGKLDWDMIFPALQKEIPEVANLICYAVRSTGGKGLGVVMAISPLPLIPSTVGNQQSVLRLQGRLLSVFDKMGLGADFGARGVSRDLPNFNNPERCVYRNTKPLRELEVTRRPVVTLLHKLLNDRDRAARISERIYNDERVEKGLAKLVLWLLGAANFDQVWQLDGQTYEKRFKCTPYLSGWSLSATMRELCTLTGISETFLRKYLKDPPKWLKSEYFANEGWNLSIPLSKDVPWLLDRSLYLLQKTQQLKGKVSFNPAEFLFPSSVPDGERNAWIVQLVLTYKWAGYALETALEKVNLRLFAIPGNETSRNCKQVKAIVRSIYRRFPENHGVLAWKDLPEWVRNDETFCSLFKRTTTRRGITPVAFLKSKSDGEAVQEFSGSERMEFICFNPTSLCHEPPRELQKELPELSVKNVNFGSVNFLDHTETKEHLKSKTLWVVRHKQRIAIFDNDKMILCMTKKHYKASRVLEFLMQSGQAYFGMKLKLISPRITKQRVLFEQIDRTEIVLHAEQICGRKETKKDALNRWRESKGVSFIVTQSHGNEDFEVPF
jgi:hypothetical protein